jgi:hypothetical protein
MPGARVEEGARYREGPPPLLGGYPFHRLPLWGRALLLAATVAAVAGAVLWASGHLPDTSPPAGARLEARVVKLFGRPGPQASDSIATGDFLVERFYILDVATGDRFIADFLKGRVEGVQTSRSEEGDATYTLLLDTRAMRRDRALFTKYVETVAPPAKDRGAPYLGLTVAGGAKDAFLLNYSGRMPLERHDFTTPDGSDAFGFLLSQPFESLTGSARLIGVEGTNFLVSNTSNFPYLASEFKLGKAVFLSELILVDATATRNRGLLLLLREQLTPTSVPR